MAYIEHLVSNLRPSIDAGIGQLRQATREALARQGCSLLAHIPPDSEALLEPLLFAHLSKPAPDVTSEQLLAGYVREDTPPLEIAVGSDQHGRVYLPRIGYFITQASQARLNLLLDPASRRHVLHDGREPVPHEFLPPLLAGPEGIEVCRHGHPLLDRFFVNREGDRVSIDVEEAIRAHEVHLGKALQAIARDCPVYASRIGQLVRRLVVFNAEGVNSFADVGAHGAAFINAREDDDEVLFIEELAHQCGHVLFSTATVDNQELFAVSPHAPLRAWTGKDDESRSLYVVLHGLFTEIAIISCLEPFLEGRNATSPRQTRELEGRLAFIISRFAADLANLGHAEVFAPRGAALYRDFLEIFNQVYGKWRDLVRHADFSNQTYTFSYERYIALNSPRERPSNIPRRSRTSGERLELEAMRPIGFGTYRTSLTTPHAQALAYALSQGCNLIDTAASYCDGESEALIGKVLGEHPEYPAFVVTKAGYLQRAAAARIHELSLPADAVVPLGEDGAHCIHPDFLRSQIQASCARLRMDCLDGFLLHNPEYHFGPAQSQTAEPAYYARIEAAFEFLEDCVHRGKIRYYGISSNTLVNATEQPRTTNLNELLRIARRVDADHHFRLLQFPFNLLEQGAARAQHCGESLIAVARRNGLVTFANRPLNALRDGKALRLATCEVLPADSSAGEEAWHDCRAWVARRMQALGIEGQPEEFDVLALLGQRWQDFDTTEAATYVFESVLFPLLSRLSGGHVADDREMAAFNRFYASVLAHARANMSAQAEAVRRESIAAGTLRDDGRPLAVAACESYLQSGIDHVLVGMRRTEYVDQLRDLFRA